MSERRLINLHDCIASNAGQLSDMAYAAFVELISIAREQSKIIGQLQETVSRHEATIEEQGKMIESAWKTIEYRGMP